MSSLAGRPDSHGAAQREVPGRRLPHQPRVFNALASPAMVISCLFIGVATAEAHKPYVAAAWGSNRSGQLGDGIEEGPQQCSPAGEVPCSTSPVPVTGLEGVTAISGGEEHSLAVLGDGTVKAWGNNELGQLGDGMAGELQPESNLPVAVQGLCCATSVAAGARHSLALLSTSEVRTWGSNESGQLGAGVRPENHPISDVPLIVRAGGGHMTGVVQLAAGEEFSLALLSSEEVKAWGNNESGQFGNNTTRDAWGPGPTVRNLGGGELAIAAGEEHSLALLAGGSVMAWGSNSMGQLGDGTFTGPQECTYGPCSRLPVPVSGLAGVDAIAAGGDFSLALLNNGTVMGWGENAHGQLGDGTTTNRDVPVAVKGLAGVVAIAAGREHSLALLSSGTVMAWGANSEGQLGTGTNNGPEKCGSSIGEETCSTTPVAVTGLAYLDVKGIAAGSWHSLAFGPPNPTVTAVSPSEGLLVGGTLVTITGREFTGATAVHFGSTSALTYKGESPTTITAVSPNGTGTVDVTVTTPEGTSPTTPADQFTYVPSIPSGPSAVGATVEASSMRDRAGSPPGGPSRALTSGISPPARVTGSPGQPLRGRTVDRRRRRHQRRKRSPQQLTSRGLRPSAGEPQR
jgi:alpha-tubulin suppressor-like RCC1 family protein